MGGFIFFGLFSIFDSTIMFAVSFSYSYISILFFRYWWVGRHSYIAKSRITFASSATSTQPLMGHFLNSVITELLFILL